MIPFTIENKESFRVIGFKTILKGGTSIHSPQFSSQKTAFFKSKVEDGQMAQLRPYSESPYGIAVVSRENGQFYYYAGVFSSKPLLVQVEEVLFPEGKYLVLSGSGGLSRLAFDKLEDYAFDTLLTGAFEYEYTGSPIAEVLLNGNPMDAEVEVWVPVQKRKGK